MNRGIFPENHLPALCRLHRKHSRPRGRTLVWSLSAEGVSNRQNCAAGIRSGRPLAPKWGRRWYGDPAILESLPDWRSIFSTLLCRPPGPLCLGALEKDEACLQFCSARRCSPCNRCNCQRHPPWPEIRLPAPWAVVCEQRAYFNKKLRRQLDHRFASRNSGRTRREAATSRVRRKSWRCSCGCGCPRLLGTQSMRRDTPLLASSSMARPAGKKNVESIASSSARRCNNRQGDVQRNCAFLRQVSTRTKKRNERDSRRR